MVAAAVVALSLAAKAPPPPHKFLAVDAHRHRVTITLIASYNGENGGFNFDGYSRYLMWTVPRGWTVRVVCTNRGPLRHSCAVVQGADVGETGVPRRGDPATADRTRGGTHRALHVPREQEGRLPLRLPGAAATRTRACGTCSRSRAAASPR